MSPARAIGDAEPAPIKRPRVVIVGGGFAGVAAAEGLKGAAVDVLLIDRKNHSTFQPLLYQVATATQNENEVARPFDDILEGQKNARFLQGDVLDIDTDRRCVVVGQDVTEVPYDYLVLAMGSETSWLGHDDWEGKAIGLKDLDDAKILHQKVLRALQAGSAVDDAAERQKLLTFVVVGGGATGVEMAGALAQLARDNKEKGGKRAGGKGSAKDGVQPRVILLEQGDRVLPAFEPELSAKAKEGLERLGVDVRLGAAVIDMKPDLVETTAGPIAARTTVWAAGVQAASLTQRLRLPHDEGGYPVERDEGGRVVVGADMGVPGLQNVFAVGDIAHAVGADGEVLPGLAPVAEAEGALVARAIRSDLEKKARPALDYHDKGAMAVLGDGLAVMQTPRRKLFGGKRQTFSGATAWAAFFGVHVAKPRSGRLRILHQWLRSSFAKQRSGGVLLEGDLVRPARPKAPPRVPPFVDLQEIQKLAGAAAAAEAQRQKAIAQAGADDGTGYAAELSTGVSGTGS
jgi:NADH dehydrogenase